MTTGTGLRPVWARIRYTVHRLRVPWGQRARVGVDCYGCFWKSILICRITMMAMRHGIVRPW